MNNNAPEHWMDAVAVVTGASSGIGAAIAEALLDWNLHVAVCGRRLDRLESLALGRDPDRFFAKATDLRDEASIRAFFRAVEDRWGGVDLLVNNAGLGRKSPLIDGDTEAWREMLEVNVLGLCICTREALSSMQSRGRAGQIVHISSMAAHRIPSESGIYSATKFAVRSLTEGLRRELRAQDSDIRVSSISPGFVETEFAEVYHGDPEAAARTYSNYPVLQPRDVAQALCSILELPPRAQVHDLLLRPTRQPD